jgi:hypothetical protein
MNGLLQQPDPNDPNAAPPAPGGAPSPAGAAAPPAGGDPSAAPDPSAGQGGAAPDDEGAEAASGQQDDEGAEDNSNVTPEEQQQYDQFVNNCYRVIYTPNMRVTILKRLAATGKPIDDLANTSVMVVQRVEQSAKQAGQPVSPDVVYHGGLEVLQDLATYAEKAKIHTYTEQETTGAWYRALDLYRQMGEASGQIDPAPLKQEFGQIAAASKDGTLNQMLPGIDAAAAAGGGSTDQGAPAGQGAPPQGHPAPAGN